jgi:hypothetical protein
MALQNGLLAQGTALPWNLHPTLPYDSSLRHQVVREPLSTAARSCCEKLAADKRRIYYLAAWSYGILLQLNGVYSRENMIFLKILLINRSGTDYAIDSLRFVIRDSQHETGEDRLTPLYVYGNAKTIKARNRELYVFTLPKFALPEKKHLDIELLEKKGGRYLRLKLGRRPIARARFV